MDKQPRTMMFNPFTGKPRDPRDIGSDPSGAPIEDHDEPLYAARKAKPPKASNERDALRWASAALAVVAPDERDRIVMDGIMLTIGEILDAANAALEPQCETMDRPKAQCGCPDCGPSLVDLGQAFGTSGHERIQQAVPRPGAGSLVPAVRRPEGARSARAAQGKDRCAGPAIAAAEAGGTCLKRDPTLAELMVEWDELAKNTPRVDMSVPIYEAARMRQRNWQRRIELAKRIAEVAKAEGETDG